MVKYAEALVVIDAGTDPEIDQDYFAAASVLSCTPNNLNRDAPQRGIPLATELRLLGWPSAPRIPLRTRLPSCIYPAT